MRIVKVARRVSAYWKELYATQPEAANLPYLEQMKWFYADFYGPVDIWQTYLRKAGHDATDMICGVDPLDAAWRAEHGGDEAGFDLIRRQVAEANPEVLVLEAIQSFSVPEIEALRASVPALRTLIGNTGFDLRNRPGIAAVDVAPPATSVERKASSSDVLP